MEYKIGHLLQSIYTEELFAIIEIDGYLATLQGSTEVVDRYESEPYIMNTGTIKWFREDGTGYIIPDYNLEETILIMDSELNLNRGLRVAFKEKIILGRKVAYDIVIK